MAEPAQPAQPSESEVFQSANTLTVSEVALVLQEYTQRQKEQNPDYQPNMLLAKTLDYASQFASTKNSETLQQMRGTLHEQGFTQQEIAMVCSLQIGTAEEAKTLVPSLERYSDDDLNRWLEEVSTYATFE